MNLQNYPSGQYNKQKQYFQSTMNSMTGFAPTNQTTYLGSKTNIELKQRPYLNNQRVNLHQNLEQKYKTDSHLQYLKRQDVLLPHTLPDMGASHIFKENQKKYDSQIEKLSKICQEFFHQNQKLKEKLNFQNYRLQQIWRKKVAQLQNELRKHREIIQHRNRTISDLQSNRRNQTVFGINSILNNSFQNSRSHLTYLENQNSYNNQHTAHRIISKSPLSHDQNLTNSMHINNSRLMQQLRSKEQQLNKYMQKQQKYIQVYVQKQQLQKQIRNLQMIIKTQTKQISEYRKSLDRQGNQVQVNTYDREALHSGRQKSKNKYEDTSPETSASMINMGKNFNSTNNYSNNNNQRSGNMNMHIIVQDTNSKRCQELQQTVQKITEYNNKLIDLLKKSSLQIQRLNNLLKTRMQQIQSNKATIEEQRTTIEQHRATIEEQRTWINEDRAKIEEKKAIIEEQMAKIDRSQVIILKQEGQIQRYKQLEVEHQRLKFLAQQFKEELNNNNNLINKVGDTINDNYCRTDSAANKQKIGGNNQSHFDNINDNVSNHVDDNYADNNVGNVIDNNQEQNAQNYDKYNQNNMQIYEQSIRQLNRCQQCWHLQERCDAYQKRIQQIYGIIDKKAEKVIELQRVNEQLKEQISSLQFRLKEQVSISWELKQMMVKMNQLNKNNQTSELINNQLNSNHLNKEIPQVENESESSKDASNYRSNHQYEEKQQNIQYIKVADQQQSNKANNNNELPQENTLGQENKKVESEQPVHNKLQTKQTIDNELQIKISEYLQQIKTLKQENSQLSNFVMKQNMEVLKVKDHVREMQKQKQGLLAKINKLVEINNDFKYKEQNMPALLQRIYNTQKKLQYITKCYNKILNDVESSVSQTQSVHKQIEQILENQNQLQFYDKPKKIYSQNDLQAVTLGQMVKINRQSEFSKMEMIKNLNNLIHSSSSVSNPQTTTSMQIIPRPNIQQSK